MKMAFLMKWSILDLIHSSIENNIFNKSEEIMESVTAPEGWLVPNWGEYIYTDDNILTTELYSFEIIGTFSAVNLIVTDTPSHDFDALRNLENQIYIPNQVAERMALFRAEKDLEIWEGEHYGFDPTVSIFYDPMFVLYDPIDLRDFTIVANEILPDFRIIRDLTSRFSEMTTSMEGLQEMASQMLWTGIGASIVILALLVTLFIRDRKQEIGIYLSLGEKKVKIIIQILFEVLAPALVGITLSLFSGNILANHMTKTMIRNDVVARVEERDREWSIMQPLGSDALAWISAPMEHLTAEEMLEQYNVALDRDVIVMFYGVGIMTILLSTTIPIVYAMRLDPKEIMLDVS